MPAQAAIERSVANGPFIWKFVVDGDVQAAATSVASIGVALDAIKPLVQGLPGTVRRITIGVDSI